MSKRIDRGRRPNPKSRRASRAVRTTAPHLAEALPEESTFRNSLTRLLETPHLARVLPHLAPETLHQLIRHCGLDASAEIIAWATQTQLTSVFDLDLWRSAQPGHEEGFDVDRFGEWVEVLAEAGGTVAARTVAAMDEQLLTAGLTRYIRVFDPAAITMPASIDCEPLDIDAVTHRGFECEMGGYLVRAIRNDSWDAIIALLLALEADNDERFHAVMGECRRLSDSAPEVDGLDGLLTEPEQLLHDVAMEREHRRSRQGYSTPADARAFLLMSRRGRVPSNGERSVNPIAAAYFRAVADAMESHKGSSPSPPGHISVPVPTLSGVPETLDGVMEILFSVGVAPQRPRALLEGTHSQPRLALVRALIQNVRDRDDALYLGRSHELAFLANTLVAGCSIQSRSFTPHEAAEAAIGVCNLGLEHWPARSAYGHPASDAALEAALPDTFLMDHDLVSAFAVGWAVLHEDVSMFVAERLAAALSDLQCTDVDIQEGLHRLRVELVRHRHAGTPWHARAALDVIAMLDIPAWASVLGLLDECPTIPAALTATLEGRTGAISATAFEFISTRSQLDSVRDFMAQFLDILSR